MAQLFKRLAHTLPNLGLKLKQSGLNLKPEQFIQRTFLSAFYLTTGLLIIAAGFLAKAPTFLKVIIVIAPVLFILTFAYFLRLPDVRARRIMADINSEIVDAGRFMIVELQSGLSLYDAMRGVSHNFERIGKQFHAIVVRIDTGTNLDDALNDIINLTPSSDLRRLLWQVLNSLKTGSDVVRGLKETVEQISHEHLIEVRKYGRKLNPLTMFYMLLAVIVPSLGITMLVVMSSLVSLDIDFTTLVIIAIFLGLFQAFFLAIVRSSRPAVNL
jgi:flagellar protein FlaJ